MDETDIMLGENTVPQCRSLVVVNDIIVQDEVTARKYNISLETFAKDYKCINVKMIENVILLWRI